MADYVKIELKTVRLYVTQRKNDNESHATYYYLVSACKQRGQSRSELSQLAPGQLPPGCELSESELSGSKFDVNPSV